MDKLVARLGELLFSIALMVTIFGFVGVLTALVGHFVNKVTGVV